MTKKKPFAMRTLKTALLTLGCLLLPALGMGCSFDPLKYFSRNACEVFNCDELFFIDDLFPLSANPTSAAPAGGSDEEADDDGGGHAH